MKLLLVDNRVLQNVISKFTEAKHDDVLILEYDSSKQNTTELLINLFDNFMENNNTQEVESIGWVFHGYRNKETFSLFDNDSLYTSLKNINFSRTKYIIDLLVHFKKFLDEDDGRIDFFLCEIFNRDFRKFFLYLEETSGVNLAGSINPTGSKGNMVSDWILESEDIPIDLLREYFKNEPRDILFDPNYTYIRHVSPSCQDGWYTPNDLICLECPLGTYSAKENGLSGYCEKHAEISCTDGKYYAFSNSNNSRLNSYKNAIRGGVLCTHCPENTYRFDDNDLNECSNCPSGKYRKPEDSYNQDNCVISFKRIHKKLGLSDRHMVDCSESSYNYMINEDFDMFNCTEIDTSIQNNEYTNGENEVSCQNGKYSLWSTTRVYVETISFNNNAKVDVSVNDKFKTYVESGSNAWDNNSLNNYWGYLLNKHVNIYKNNTSADFEIHRRQINEVEINYDGTTVNVKNDNGNALFFNSSVIFNVSLRHIFIAFLSSSFWK